MQGKIIEVQVFWHLSQAMYMPKMLAQHDELESNLKKIPHRNGIWGLEAIVM